MFNTCLVIVILLLLGVLVFGYSRVNEHFNFVSCNNKCSPFGYPDMYDPKLCCSDPFKWGWTYGTGPNADLYKPVYQVDELNRKKGYNGRYRYDYR